MHRASFFRPLSTSIRSPFLSKNCPRLPTLARKMASEQPAVGLHKDPVTGEMISKTSAHFVISFANPVLTSHSN